METHWHNLLLCAVKMNRHKVFLILKLCQVQKVIILQSEVVNLG